MGLESKFTPFSRVSEADDLDALVRAFAWLSENRKRTIILPDEDLDAPGVITLQGADRARVRSGGDTRIKNVRFVASGTYDCEWESLSLLATTPINGSAITVQTAVGQPTGQNVWRNVRVEGPYSRAVKHEDPGGIGNNDFNEWDSLTVHGILDEAVWIDSPMSVGHVFSNCHFTEGKAGIRSRGGFHWDKGRMSDHTIANFIQETINSVAGCIHIEGLNSEKSARLYINYAPSKLPSDPPPATFAEKCVPGTTQLAGIPIIIDGGTRFALDRAVVDASDNVAGTDFQYGVEPTGDRIGIVMPVNCGFRGPYTIKESHFSNGLQDNIYGAKRVRFRVAGGGQQADKGGIIEGCTIATNNINAQLLDRGRAQSNLAYMLATGTFEWFPDHAP